MITKRKLWEILKTNPIIAAVKDEQGLSKALASDNKIVFVLYADILNLDEIIERILKSGKIPFVHIDMVTGLATNPMSIKYILKNHGKNCGVITTKGNLVKEAVDVGITVIQRLFVIDSLSIENNVKSIKRMKPDAIEIMPGVIPKVIKKIQNEVPNTPIIAGGLIETEEEVIDILNHGGMAISTTRENLWKVKRK
ncbi:glycerol-3-phosphate responsive antiterminator [Alkalibacter saccharofermentans]|uniref:Glycerol uptake operon antiterminator n=1 Tax=Alkalibacter saccharofermentans DSM 14828 TaxID=1120975 RepID=A0A1M4U8L1_9FIRM|nr:glycerol-3-phosphate responsive antiterminator [Alkalibacter saccharofermentans]SHE52893.1 glycerol uptake operon antiterminator [Alkalibacter saccharofermentans DSM 14828]